VACVGVVLFLSGELSAEGAVRFETGDLRGDAFDFFSGVGLDAGVSTGPLPVFAVVLSRRVTPKGIGLAALRVVEGGGGAKNRGSIAERMV
jgi:hypothetical protein